MANYQLGPVIGKIGGGSEIQVHPVEVAYQTYGSYADREVLKVPGEPGVWYLITIVGHYDSDGSWDNQQLRWRTESSDWLRIAPAYRGGQTQVAVLAQGGDTLTVSSDSLDEQQGASFIGKAYVTPVPEVGVGEGNTTTFPIGPMKVAGTRSTEHPVADLEIPPGEVWRVKVTGTYYWDNTQNYLDNNKYPSVMVGPKQTKPVRYDYPVEVETYVSTVSRISLITNHRAEVEFEGTAEITPMKW